jgi:hypothetical protein
MKAWEKLILCSWRGIMKRTKIAVAVCVLAAWIMPLQGIAQAKTTTPAAKPAKSSSGGWTIHFADTKPYTTEDGTKGQMTLTMELKNKGMGPYCRYEGKSTLKSVGAKEMMAAGVELIAEKVSLNLIEHRAAAPVLAPPQVQVPLKGKLSGLCLYGSGTIVYRLKEIVLPWGKSTEDLGTWTVTCVLHSPVEEQYEELINGGTKSDQANNALFIEMTDPAGQVFTFLGIIKKGQ